ncbi:MAG: hypothetical protein RLZ49_625 [Actinomycetota bacterium]
MDLSAVNWLGVLAVFVVNFLIGFAWFNGKTFYPLWWKALGKSPSQEPGQGQSMGVVFGATVLAGLVLSTAMSVLATLIAQVNGETFTVSDGISLGLFVGVGIVSAQALSHKLFGQQGWMVWLIESGGDVAAAVGMGIVLSFIY